MNEYLTQIRTFYTALEEKQRRLLVTAIGIALFSIVGVGIWASYVPYQTLMSGRDYEDLLTAAAALDSNDVPYQLDENGSLSVPRNALGRARAAVAGSEIMPSLNDVADLKLGLTPQAQDWAFLRAKEGDIARMIGEINGISGARVSVVPREESLYFGDERPARASVMIKLKPGFTLTTTQISAITNLVAHAVDGLDPSQVTVADDRGSLLAEGGGEASLDDSDPRSLLEYRLNLERKFERAVSRALLPVIGNSADFSVTAAVDIDLTSVERATKRFDVDNQAILSEHVDESNSAKTKPGGVPGVDANLPERNSAATTNANTSESSRSTANYVYPSTNEVSHTPAGEVERISVAVQVSSDRIKQLAEIADIETTELEAQIKSAVEAAVGFNQERGDLVSVNFMPFTASEWVEPETGFSIQAADDYIPYLLAAAALALTFVMVVRPLIRAVTNNPARRRDSDERSAEQRASQDESSADIAGRLRALVDNYQPVDASDLNNLVGQESNVAAQVLRQWHRTS